jgi:hypothetical protein
MVGDLVVAVVADAAAEQEVLCRADAGGDGVPDRGPQRESSPGGVYGTLLSGHGLASARFPVRVPYPGRAGRAPEDAHATACSFRAAR